MFLSFDGLTFYASGDTSRTEEMEDLAKKHLDYAVYPCDGVYNMDVNEASQCARLSGGAPQHPGAYEARRAV